MIPDRTYPLSPSAVLDRLKPLETTWRKAERSAVLEASRFDHCTVTPHDGYLYLELLPQGRGPEIHWRIDLDPVEASTTRVRTRWEFTTSTIGVHGVLLAVILILLLRTPGLVFGRIDPYEIVIYLGFIGLLWLATSWRVSSQEEVVSDLLKRLGAGQS